MLTCVCVSLCTTAVHNTAQNSYDNLLSYPPDNHRSSDDVYRRGGMDLLYNLLYSKNPQRIHDRYITSCTTNIKPKTNPLHKDESKYCGPVAINCPQQAVQQVHNKSTTNRSNGVSALIAFARLHWQYSRDYLCEKGNVIVVVCDSASMIAHKVIPVSHLRFCRASLTRDFDARQSRIE